LFGQYVERIPIHPIELDAPTPLRERSAEAGRQLYERYCQNGEHQHVLAFVELNLGQKPTQELIVYDLLVFLAEQMMALNKDKQRLINDFWLDLEGVAYPGIFDVVRNKGKWETTLWKAQACRPFVDKESRSTRHLDESLGWNEEAFKAFVKALVGSVPNLSDLVRVYRKHHPAYRDLEDCTDRTDHLIDQVVYKLYGLTEEEIAIVEGK
jgi:hypothetical protein